MGVVRRYIDILTIIINFPYSTCISSFFGWLQCIGVASGCCCKEVYRYPHNNY